MKATESKVLTSEVRPFITVSTWYCNQDGDDVYRDNRTGEFLMGEFDKEVHKVLNVRVSDELYARYKDEFDKSWSAHRYVKCNSFLDKFLSAVFGPGAGYYSPANQVYRYTLDRDVSGNPRQMYSV